MKKIKTKEKRVAGKAPMWVYDEKIGWIDVNEFINKLKKQTIKLKRSRHNKEPVVIQ